MNDLLVSSMTPALGSGTGLRTYGVVAALARRGSVHVRYVSFGGRAAAREYDALGAVTLEAVRASRGPRRALAYLRARRRGVPEAFARGVSPELAGAAATAGPLARVIADGPVAAAALLPLARSRRLVYLAHNLESSFRTDSGRGDLLRFEREVLQRFAVCWMPTRADVHGARELGGPGVDACYVPNVVDVARIEPVAPAGTGRALFVADFTYAPNREALRYLAEAVLPHVWARRPAVRLALVGRGLEDWALDARIERHGYVEDLAAVYRACDVVVVPLLRGGGSPLKFIEGLAYGLPVVATNHAARLLEDGVAGRDFLAAATAEEFARALEMTLDDTARAAELGTAGRELAARCHSIEALASILAA